jgi:hypothetical protein
MDLYLFLSRFWPDFMEIHIQETADRLCPERKVKISLEN